MSFSHLSTKSSQARVVLIISYTVTWLVVLILSVAVRDSEAWYIPLIIIGIAGAVLVIYVPSALLQTWRNSDSSFDHAGGEVAFVAVSLTTWVACAVFTTAWIANAEECLYGSHDKNAFYKTRGCRTLAALAALSWFETLICAVWLGIVVYRVHRTEGYTRKQAFKLPTHKLLNGTYHLSKTSSLFGEDELLRRGETRA